MNKRKFISTALLLTSLSLAFIFMTAKPVFAASVTLSPDQGKTGTTTHVSGAVLQPLPPTQSISPIILPMNRGRALRLPAMAVYLALLPFRKYQPAHIPLE